MKIESLKNKKSRGRGRTPGRKISLQKISEMTKRADLEWLLIQRKKTLIESLYRAEIDVYLGYDKSNRRPKSSKNYRNGYFPKVIQMKRGEVEVMVPRDRNGKFKPRVVRKSQLDVSSIEDKILGCCIFEMSIIDIEDNINGVYKDNEGERVISIDKLLKIVDRFNANVRAWQSRKLKSEYAMILVYQYSLERVYKYMLELDRNVSICVGVEPDGSKEILSMHVDEFKDDKYWMMIINDLKSRGVRDVWCFSTDKIPGISSIIKNSYPNAVQDTSFLESLKLNRR